MKTVYLGDDGTVLILDTCVNITQATAQTIEIEKPSGAALSLASNIYNKTSLKAVMLAADFNEIGIYKMQAEITLPSWAGRGETVEVEVKPLLT